MPESQIAGVDEAGRGPLAGPLLVAAVILPPHYELPGLDDSKRVTQQRREQLFSAIQQQAVAYSIQSIDIETIDRLNILQATLYGMQRAVVELNPAPDQVKVDGNRLPELPVPAEAVINGDHLIPAISAASILAKVSRDRIMLAAHQTYPQYGFDRHKGYPTPQHRKALVKYGPCPIHRRSFAPVQAQLKLALKG